MAALYNACVENELGIVQLLLQHGCDVNFDTGMGVTPLHAASGRGHEAIVRVLLENGANVNKMAKLSEFKDHVPTPSDHAPPVEHGGWTPLHLSIGEGQDRVVRLLLEHGAGVDNTDGYGFTPLHYASHRGFASIVKILLEHGADVNHAALKDVAPHPQLQHQGRTPLFSACEQGRLDVVQALLDHGGDVHATDKYGWPPVKEACRTGMVDCGKLMLDRGADLEHRDKKQGWTAIYYAVANNHEAMARFLLQRGANVNHRADDGQTPLMVAVHYKRVLPVLVLLAFGADPTIPDNSGRTAVDEAVAGGDEQIIKMVRAAAASRLLHRSCVENDLDAALALLDNNTGPDTKNDQGSAPIHVACKHGSLAVVKALVDHGADINALDAEGNTPLHIATQQNNLPLIQFLVDSGARTDICNDSGDTAYMCTLRRDYILIEGPFGDRPAFHLAGCDEHCIPRIVEAKRRRYGKMMRGVVEATEPCRGRLRLTRNTLLRFLGGWHPVRDVREEPPLLLGTKRMAAFDAFVLNMAQHSQQPCQDATVDEEEEEEEQKQQQQQQQQRQPPVSRLQAVPLSPPISAERRHKLGIEFHEIQAQLADVVKELEEAEMSVPLKKRKRDAADHTWARPYFESTDFKPGSLHNGSKFVVLLTMLHLCVQLREKVLVFSQSLFALDLVESFLKRLVVPGTREAWQKKKHYFRLDGSTSASERADMIEAFNDRSNLDMHAFLISTRAGSLGISLTAASRVVILDTSWNPSHDAQAVCRVYRYGQDKPCFIYRLVAAGTMEETIYNRQVTKVGLANRVVDTENPERHFTEDQLRQLFTYNAPAAVTEETAPRDISDGRDIILKKICEGDCKKHLAKAPFMHSSMLEECTEDDELSKNEQEDALRRYARDKLDLSNTEQRAAGGVEEQADFGQLTFMSDFHSTANMYANTFNSAAAPYQQQYPSPYHYQQRQQQQQPQAGAYMGQPHYTPSASSSASSYSSAHTYAPSMGGMQQPPMAPQQHQLLQQQPSSLSAGVPGMSSAQHSAAMSSSSSASAAAPYAYYPQYQQQHQQYQQYPGQPYQQPSSSSSNPPPPASTAAAPQYSQQTHQQTHQQQQGGYAQAAYPAAPSHAQYQQHYQQQQPGGTGTNAMTAPVSLPTGAAPAATTAPSAYYQQQQPQQYQQQPQQAQQPQPQAYPQLHQAQQPPQYQQPHTQQQQQQPGDDPNGRAASPLFGDFTDGDADMGMDIDDAVDGHDEVPPLGDAQE